MTAPDAMPERVEQPTVDEIQAGTAYITADPVAHKVCNWMIAFGRRDAESRLLAAEARVREVEAEMLDTAQQAMREQLAALRAERDTLVPLARLGIVALDDDDGRFPSGDAIRFGVLNGRFEETPVVARARALLRREEEA